MFRKAAYFLLISLFLWFGIGSRYANARLQDTAPIFFATTQIQVLRTRVEYGRDYTYQMQFFTMQVDGSARTPLGSITFTDCTSRGGQNCTLHSAFWLPKHNLIAFRALIYGVEGLYLLDLKGEGVPQAIVNAVLPSQEGQLVVSPDQMWLAYLREKYSDETVGSYRLFMLPIQGEPNAFPIADDLPAWQMLPEFDPQGEYILFQSGDLSHSENNALNISRTHYRARLDGSQRLALPLPALAVNVQWSPTGEQIAYCEAGRSNTHIILADRDGQTLRRITQSPVPCAQLSWSPQGDLLLLSDLQTFFTIRIADGNLEKRFTSTQFITANAVRWSPDGQYIAFIRENALEVLSLADNSLQRLTDSEFVAVLDWR